MRSGSGGRLVVLSVAAALVVLAASSPAVSSSAVTLTVSITGAGAGSVTSFPAGISCPSVCAAQFPAGTSVVLEPTPDRDSVFGNWSITPDAYTCAPSDIHDQNACPTNLGGSDVSAQATFDPAPPCTVPAVEGKTLAEARPLLARNHCRVGTVRYVVSRKAQQGRVISQSPKAHWQLVHGAVDLVIGAGSGTLPLGPASSGHTYSLAPGTKIVVTLPSNASTGYHWRLAAKPDGSVVKLVSHRYVAPKSGSNPGASGKEIWRFRAVGAGATRLRLTYGQAGTKHVGQAFHVKLHVL